MYVRIQSIELTVDALTENVNWGELRYAELTYAIVIKVYC